MESTNSQAQAHHDRTVHRPHRLSGARGPLDWSNRPRPDKRYRDLEPQPLPTVFPSSEAPAVSVLIGDIPFKGGRFEGLTGLARLLFSANGVMRRRELEQLTLHFRTAPSAGALYPVEAYVVCGDLGDLPAGVYHFEPITFSLQQLREGDWRGRLGEAAADPELAAAPVTVALTGVPWRTTWKYGERGYRHLFWDAGAVAANLMECAAARRLPTRLVSSFVDDTVAQLLAITADQAPAQGGETPLALLPVGHPGEEPPEAGEPPARHLEVEPLSREVVEEPQLWETHRAGDLDTADAVTAWRSQLHEAATESTAKPEIPPLDGEPIDEVLLRRGSTRRFTHDAVPREKFDWPLGVAARHVPGDLVPEGHTHLTSYVVVHAVEDADPGAYEHRDGELVWLHGDASRHTTAELCLGQPLGGDAAYTTFLAADLERLVATAGDRAYRAAHLEAGVAAERLQLAAFCANAGASGLTFFDEEVRTFFATSKWPMLTVAVGVPAYEARPGERPGEPT
jgi:SagB-type dehydrogenase family enzyme